MDRSPLTSNSFIMNNNNSNSRSPSNVSASPSSSTSNPMLQQRGGGVSSHNSKDSAFAISLQNQQQQSVSLDRDSIDSTTSNWMRDLASEYDFCLVFPAENGEFSKKGQGYIRTLRKLGYELFIYKNINENNEIFVLVRATIEKLRAFADNCDYSMLLDAKEVETRLLQGDPEKNIESVEINHMPEITHYRPCEKIYGKYSRTIDETLYYREHGMNHPFRELVRLKLTAMILESRPSDGSQNLKIRRYIRSKWLKACFPLHNRSKTENIEMKWSLYPRQSLPLHDLKEYFGEKVALYFAFLEHYTTFLWIPALIGLPFQIAVFVTGDYSAPFLPAFSFFIALWAVTMLEFWKRKEKTTALDWGTIDFETKEVDRPDFKGETIKSFIDGSEIRYFPSKTRSFYVVQSLMAIGGLILLVTGIVVSIYIMRYAIVKYVGDSNAQTLASVANAVQIQIMNFIYSFLANALSERENHRTDTQFEDSMITKIFLFQFVNSYASFFYLAFVAKYIEGGCPDNDCMKLLSINLAIIYGTRLVVGNLTELLLPYLAFQYKHKYRILVHGGKMSRPEKEFLLEPYDLLASSLDDYAEVAIQYGYTAMFVTALPMAACFAYISNIAEIKGDGWKLLNLHQRPVPKAAEDIGTWQLIFLMISVIAVITNAGLTVFTMNALDVYSETFRYWVFILFQWVCFTLQAIIMAVIPDVPEEIEIQLDRTEFIVSKLIDKVGDDNTSDVAGAETATIEFQKYPLDQGGEFLNKTHFLTEDMK